MSDNLFNYVPPTKEEAKINRAKRNETIKNRARNREHRGLIERMSDTNPRFPPRSELPERVYINDTKHQREDEERDTQLPGNKRRTVAVEEIPIFGQPGKIQPFVVGKRPDPSSSGFSHFGPRPSSSSGSEGIVSAAARRANPRSFGICGERDSTARDNCERAKIGILSSRARFLRPRDISEIS